MSQPVLQQRTVNDVVISGPDQIGFLLNRQINSLIEMARLHRKTHWHAIESLYVNDKARGTAYKFFRDFCTVKLVLPLRTGMSTWCQRNLKPEDLYISRVNWNLSAFKCKVSTWSLGNIDTDNPPDLIVLDDARWASPASIKRVYGLLGKDPERQLFLLLG